MTEWSEDGGQKKNKRERAEFGGLVNHATSPPLINYAGPPSSFPSSPSSLATSLYEQVDMSAFVRSHFIRLEPRTATPRPRAEKTTTTLAMREPGRRGVASDVASILCDGQEREGCRY